MKQSLSLILMLVYTALGFWIPEYADLSDFYALFGNISALGVGISVFTEAIKTGINYDSETSWKGYPIIISIAVATILGLFAFFMNIPGLFAEMTTWIEALIVSLITWGIARGYYHSDFGYMLIKLALGKDLNK